MPAHVSRSAASPAAERRRGQVGRGQLHPDAGHVSGDGVPGRTPRGQQRRRGAWDEHHVGGEAAEVGGGARGGEAEPEVGGVLGQKARQVERREQVGDKRAVGLAPGQHLPPHAEIDALEKHVGVGFYEAEVQLARARRVGVGVRVGVRREAVYVGAEAEADAAAVVVGARGRVRSG